MNLAPRRPLVILGALLLCLVLAPAVAAADPPTLTGTITDRAGSQVQADDPTITRALTSLSEGHGVSLKVLLDHSMNGADPNTYPKTVATANNLGDHEALLVITFDDREFGLWVGEGVANVSAADLSSILNGAVKEHLRNQDTAGAIVAAADGLGLVLNANAGGNNGGNGGNSGATPVPAQPSAPADFSGLANFLGLLLILTIAFIVIGLCSAFGLAWWKARAAVRAIRVRRAALSAGSAQAFLAADEAQKSAEQEVDFAQAEFGDEIATPYRTHLVATAGELQKIATLQAAVSDPGFGHDPAADASDDDRPRGLFGRFFAARTDRAVAAAITAYTSIQTRASAVSTSLAALVAEIAQLRELQHSLPSRLPGLKTALAAASAKISAATPIDAALAKRSPSAYRTVAVNLAGAIQLHDLATADLASAAAALAADASGPASGQGALAAQRAADRLAKIGTLLAALTTMRDEVEKAANALPGHLAAAEAEIGKATRADTADDVRGEETEIAKARAILGAAAATATSDPYQADQLALKAAATADAVIGEVRDAISARQRREAAAREAYASAGQSLTQAKSYIASHHGVVSASARSDLESAEQRFGSLGSSPSTAQLLLALALLNSVQGDAEQAYSSAQSDVAEHEAAEERSSYHSYDSYHGGSGISSGSSFGGGTSFGGSFGGGGGVSAGGHW